MRFIAPDRARVGDRVLAYDEETGETASQLVTATWGHQDPVVVQVRVGDEQLVATPDHPFSVVGRGWVKASDLRPGDRIHRAFGGTGPVIEVTVARQPQVMYNLTVDTAHTFFVGDAAWLTHNPGGYETAFAGREAEAIVSQRLGIPRNAGQGLVTISVDGRVRIPDLHPGLTRDRLNAIIEVKDVIKLKTTQQLRDLHAAAESFGGKLHIYTDGKLPGRGWLARRIAREQILVKAIRCP